MGTENQMAMAKAQKKAAHDEQERQRVANLVWSLQAALSQIVEKHPPIKDQQHKPTLAELLARLHPPKNYTIDSRRARYLDELLLQTGIPLWQRNGQKITSLDQMPGSAVLKDVVSAVKAIVASVK